MAHESRSGTTEQGARAQHHAHVIHMGNEMGIHRYRQDESHQSRPCGRFIEEVETVEDSFCEGVPVALGLSRRTHPDHVHRVRVPWSEGQ